MSLQRDVLSGRSEYSTQTFETYQTSFSLATTMLFPQKDYLVFLLTPPGNLVIDSRCFLNETKHGAIAQLGERLTGSQEVVGSIPSSSTKSKGALQCFCNAPFSFPLGQGSISRPWRRLLLSKSDMADAHEGTRGEHSEPIEPFHWFYIHRKTPRPPAPWSF